MLDFTLDKSARLYRCLQRIQLGLSASITKRNLREGNVWTDLKSLDSLCGHIP